MPPILDVVFLLIYHRVMVFVAFHLENIQKDGAGGTKNVSVCFYMLLVLTNQDDICEVVGYSHVMEHFPQMIRVGIPG